MSSRTRSRRSWRLPMSWMSSGSPTIPPAVIRGLRLEYWSWKIIFIRRRMRRSSDPLSLARSTPSKVMGRVGPPRQPPPTPRQALVGRGAILADRAWRWGRHEALAEGPRGGGRLGCRRVVTGDVVGGGGSGEGAAGIDVDGDEPRVVGPA